MADRLDAWLARRGLGSRSQTGQLIRSGAVTLDGVVCRDRSRHLTGERVAVRGEPVGDRPVTATLLVHKPLGCACSHDPAEAPLLYDLVGPPWRHLLLQSAGRLDRATSGLLVLSTDGALIHRLAHPRRHIAKRYRLTYRGRLDPEAALRCARGLLLEDDARPTLPARLLLEGNGSDGLGRATLHLHEGRHHQVRRMIAALGGEVQTLHRDRIGACDLPADLGPGMMRPARADELTALFSEPEA